MASTNRLTGLMSGMDTEGLISQLVEAKKAKVTAATKDQSAIKYRQEAWESLNKKLKSFQTTMSNIRFSNAYSKKKTSVSDSSVASVITSDEAMVTNQTLKVNQLAKSAYLTGGELKKEDGTKATVTTKLTDLGAKVGDTISINVGGKTKDIKVTENLNLYDFANELSSAGVMARFDKDSQRFFIGAKDTGAKYDFNITGSEETLKALGLDYGKDAEGKATGAAKKIDGQDAIIELNGVEFKGASNTFNINGLSITANALTTGEGVMLNTTKDTSATYDVIKKAIKEYSDLINEMDKLYNVKKDKSYKPLTDEEKADLSDYEIEKWEDKVKEQALSKDANLSDLIGKFTEAFNKGFKVNGKTMYLHDFGIETAGYFDSGDNEKHALHIKGDKEDEKFSGETNTLEFMISSDPEAVTSFFTQLSNAVYDAMNTMSARVANTRSFGNFFDDVKLKADYTDYTSKISDLEQKMFDYEDKWYKKFSKMETKMAKMQSNANAVGSFFGN